MSQDSSSGTADIPPERLHRFTRSLRELGRARDLDEALQLIVDLGTELIDGVDFADVMFVGSHLLTTPVATDEIARRVDQAQLDTGEGPCLSALHDQKVVVSRDLEQETRWPEFTSRALGLGIRSVAAYQLFRTRQDGQDWVGVLNMFGTQPGFDELDVELGALFADYCAAVLANHIEEEGVQVGLLAREVVGQATGILMVRHQLTPDEASAMLRRVSTEHGIEIHVLASQIIAGTTTLP